MKDLATQLPQIMEFCGHAIDRGLSLFAESLVPFKQELAIIGCRSITGEFMSYPLVLSEQRNGICWDVTGPATALGVDPSLAAQAAVFARAVAEAAQIVGCFALEFFETADGKLWVNEMAPRVHNSGHYTQDACATSQFENHWRAVLGLPLGAADARPAFVMGNLLGPEGLELPAAKAGTSQTDVETALALVWENGIAGGQKARSSERRDFRPGGAGRASLGSAGMPGTVGPCAQRTQRR